MYAYYTAYHIYSLSFFFPLLSLPIAFPLLFFHYNFLYIVSLPSSSSLTFPTFIDLFAPLPLFFTYYLFSPPLHLLLTLFLCLVLSLFYSLLLSTSSSLAYPSSFFFLFLSLSPSSSYNPLLLPDYLLNLPPLPSFFHYPFYSLVFSLFLCTSLLFLTSFFLLFSFLPCPPLQLSFQFSFHLSLSSYFYPSSSVPLPLLTSFFLLFSLALSSSSSFFP